MKKITSLISLLLLTHFAIAQNPYDVSIKTENFAEKRTLEAQAKRETFGKCKFVNTFDFKEGERFIFEKNETAIKEGRDMQWYFLTKEMKKDDYRRTKLSYKDYAGKIVKIIKFEEKKFSITCLDVFYIKELCIFPLSFWFFAPPSIRRFLLCPPS